MRAVGALARYLRDRKYNADTKQFMSDPAKRIWEYVVIWSYLASWDSGGRCWEDGNVKMLKLASKLLSNGSVNTLHGNGYVHNNRRIVGGGVFSLVCSEAT
jgi:hypothetical protein